MTDAEKHRRDALTRIGWRDEDERGLPAGFEPDFLSFLGQVAKSPDAGGLWFLLVLFECHLLLLTASLLSRRWTLPLAALFLLLLNILIMSWPAANWLGLGLLRWQFLFFLAGYWMSTRRQAPPGTLGTLLLLLGYGLLAQLWYRKGAVPVDLLWPGLSGGLKQLAVQGFHALTAFTGIAALLGLMRMIDKLDGRNPLPRGLHYLGQSSIEIYAGHYTFLYIAVACTTVVAGKGHSHCGQKQSIRACVSSGISSSSFWRMRAPMKATPSSNRSTSGSVPASPSCPAISGCARANSRPRSRKYASSSR